jgi:predicted DNA binding CopG/RHH family protein
MRTVGCRKGRPLAFSASAQLLAEGAHFNDEVLPNLKPTLRTISLRLPESMLEELKLLANKRDVPYQSLLKMFLAEPIEQELRASKI